MIRNTKSGLKADIIDFEKSTIDMVDVLDYKKLGLILICYFIVYLFY